MFVKLKERLGYLGHVFGPSQIWHEIEQLVRVGLSLLIFLAVVAIPYDRIGKHAPAVYLTGLALLVAGGPPDWQDPVSRPYRGEVAPIIS